MHSASINRFEWLKAVLQAEGLTPTAKTVASALAVKFFNEESGQMNPTQETLADFLKVHKDTVKRVLRELRNAGWLLVTGNGGRRRAPQFRFLSPGKIVPFRDVKRGDKSSPEPEKRGDDLCEKGGANPPPVFHGTNHRTKGAEKSERPAPHLRRCIKPDTPPALAWDGWLVARGFPPLAKMGIRSSDAGGVGWDVPFTLPPKPDDPIELRIAEKWAGWATDQAEKREWAYA